MLLQRSEEHTSELQSPYVISYAVFCLKKKTNFTAIKLHSRRAHSLHVRRVRRPTSQYTLLLTWCGVSVWWLGLLLVIFFFFFKTRATPGFPPSSPTPPFPH